MISNFFFRCVADKSCVTLTQDLRPEFMFETPDETPVNNLHRILQ